MIKAVHFLSFLLVFSFIFGSALQGLSYGAGRESAAEIHLSTGGILPDYSISNENTAMSRADATLFFTRHLALELSYIKTLDVSSTSTSISMYSAGPVYHFFINPKTIPYIIGGVGRGDFSSTKVSKRYSVVNAGGGIKYFFSKDLGLRVDLRDYVTTSGYKNNFTITAGITYLIGVRPPERRKIEELKVAKKEKTETITETPPGPEGRPSTIEEEEMYEAEELPGPSPEYLALMDKIKKRLEAKKEVGQEEVKAGVVSHEVRPEISKDSPERVEVANEVKGEERMELAKKEVPVVKQVPQKEVAVAGGAVAEEVVPGVVPQKAEEKKAGPEKVAKVQEETTKAPEKMVGVVTDKQVKELKIEFYYDFNSIALTSEAIHELNRLIETVKGHKIKRVYIEGYSCAHGSRRYNMRLSKKRALRVRKYLKDRLGLPDNLFSVKAYGETHLKYPEIPTPENKNALHVRMNRRVVVRIEFIK